MGGIAIELKNISKKYILRHEKPTLIESVLGHGKEDVFWALKDIDLKVRRGETVGIIGPNGSGKTTLLKIIAGITTPTEGGVEVKDKVVSLIELGAGFHPELTGEENIYLNGMIIGISKEEIKKKFTKIIKFASIGSFIDTPLYTYSDGMRLRLGFAIAVHSEPDILILDENMAVGDADFKKKSQEKIKGFIKEGKTLIIASHQFDLLRKNVRRVVWLDRGKINKDGPTEKVLKRVENLYS